MEVGVLCCTELGNEKEKENKLEEDQMEQTNKLDLLISVICFLSSTVSCTLDLNGRPCYATKYDCQLNNLIFSQMMFFGEAWESVKFILL